MGKVSGTPPAKKLESVMVKKSVVADYGEFVQLSWEHTLEDSVVLLYGPYGGGKSTCAATVSKHWPKGGLPKTKHTGSKPSVVLSDMFWLSLDKGATDGFRERGIAVPEFSLPRFMGTPALWKKAGITLLPGEKRPTIRQAIEFGLNVAQAAVANGAEWVVVDTLTALDSALEAYGRSHMPKGREESDDTRAMFGQMFYGHKMFYDGLRGLGCGLVLCTHTKDVGDTTKMKEEEKRRLLTLSAAGMPTLMPALTGKGATVYKGDPSLQLAIIARMDPTTKRLVRKAYTIQKEGWESKNRFELSLSPEEDPDLGAMFRKVRG